MRLVVGKAPRFPLEFPLILQILCLIVGSIHRKPSRRLIEGLHHPSSPLNFAKYQSSAELAFESAPLMTVDDSKALLHHQLIVGALLKMN